MMRERLRQVLNGGVDFISILVHPSSKSWGRSQVRILLYHRVCDLPSTKDSMADLNVPPVLFAQQMAFLSQNGFKVITLEQLIDYKDENIKPPARGVIITFDDGYQDNYFNAFPILKKYGLKGTFFVVTDYVDGSGFFHWLKLEEKSAVHSRENRQYWLPLSRQQILDMSAHGACFGSHSKSHCGLSQIDEGQAAEELKGSRVCLEGILQRPVRCFSYPYGDVSQSARAQVKAAGYEAAVGITWGGNSLRSDFLKLRRIEISGRDSLAKFARKVDGAYDWLGYLVIVKRFGQQVMFRGRRGRK